MFWPPDSHFLGKVGGSCEGFGSSRHMEFVNVGRYTGGAPVLLMETETHWARALAAMTDEQVVSAVMAELRRMFPGAPQPSAAVVARLGNDTFQRGAFSYLEAGTTHELHQQLSVPLASSRLLFAGEHTSALHAGTVHGAVISGRQAAAMVRAAIAGAEPLSAGLKFINEYQDRLFRSNYGDDDDDDEDENDEYSWNRNP